MDTATKKKIYCLCGACKHNAYDQKCLYNKILCKDEPEKAQAEALIKLFETVLKSSKKPKTTSKTKPTKTTKKQRKL